VEEQGLRLFKRKRVVLSEEGYARAMETLERLREIAKELEREARLRDRELIDELGAAGATFYLCCFGLTLLTSLF